MGDEVLHMCLLKYVEWDHIGHAANNSLAFYRARRTEMGQQSAAVTHRPRYAALTRCRPLHQPSRATSVLSMLLQNLVCSRETHLESADLSSARCRRRHGNEEPNRCTSFVREHTSIVLFFPALFHFMLKMRSWSRCLQPEGMKILLPNGSYIEAHNHWYSLRRILTACIGHYSFGIIVGSMFDATR